MKSGRRLVFLFARADGRRGRVYLTGAGRLVLVAAALFGLALVLAGTRQLVQGVGLRPLATPPPPVAPTVWPPTATPAAAACQVTWRLLPLAPGADAGTVDDPGVIEKIRADYLAAWNWLYVTPGPWQAGQIEQFYRGAARDHVRSEISRHLGRGEYFNRVISRRSLSGVYFASATRAVFGDLEFGLVKQVFDARTGQEKARIQNASMAFFQVSVVYEPRRCRWQIEALVAKPFRLKGEALK